MERFGFIQDKLDIKILILFVLGQLENGVALERLCELAICDDGVGYFDFLECITELGESAHLEERDELIYITEKGRRNGKATENSLAYTVRRQVEQNVLLENEKSRRKAMLIADVIPRESGGFDLCCSLSDGLGVILDLKLYAATEMDAEKMAKTFTAQAELVHGKIVAALMEAKGSNNKIGK